MGGGARKGEEGEGFERSRSQSDRRLLSTTDEVRSTAIPYSQLRRVNSEVCTVVAVQVCTETVPVGIMSSFLSEWESGILLNLGHKGMPVFLNVLF